MTNLYKNDVIVSKRERVWEWREEWGGIYLILYVFQIGDWAGNGGGKGLAG